MSASTVRIASVFPELLGTYGDGGNVRVLARRLLWRGIGVEVLDVPVSAPLPEQVDLYVLGGGEDDAQQQALEGLRRSHLLVSVAAGAHVFAVCAGLQLLGHTLPRPDGAPQDGVGLLDAGTTRLPRRVVGEVLADPAPGYDFPVLTGFANHGGGTTLGPAAQPLGIVTHGGGNDGRPDGPEGVVQGRVVATYLHGPVLARNPGLADWLLGRVLGAPLSPLEHAAPEALHEQRVAARR